MKPIERRVADVTPFTSEHEAVANFSDGKTH